MKVVKDVLKWGGWLDNVCRFVMKKNDVGDVECVILFIKRGAETAIFLIVILDVKFVLVVIEVGDVVVCDDSGYVNGGFGLMFVKKM